MMENKENPTFNLDQIPYREISNSDKLVNEPLISVALITYNQEPYIAKAIQSVLDQRTEYSFELIIGEDCSADRTGKIVLEYQKKYPEVIRVLIPEHNAGAAGNVLRIEQACRGKYIAYCEGDDFWNDPYKLQKQMDFLENHPDFGLVHSDWDSFNVSTGKVVRNVNRVEGKAYDSEPSDLFLSILERKYCLKTLTVCVRKNLLLDVLNSDPIVFKKGCFLMGDTPRWLELSRITRFKYMNDSLGTYNILVESASHSQDSRKVYEFYLSIFDTIRYYSEKYIPSYDMDSVMSRYLTMMLKYAYFNRDSELAKKTRDLASEFNWIQLLLYIGTTNRLINLALAPVANLVIIVKDLKRRCRAYFYMHH